MNRTADQEQLLKDVLVETMPASLREDLLAQTLRQVRRRRHTRQVRRMAGALAILVGLGFILWPRPPHTLVQRTPVKSYVLVRTQPLPSGEIVKTVSLAEARHIISSPAVGVISTATAPRVVREIDDADLLSLAAPNPVVLVRLGPHSAQLVFAPTTDVDAAEHQTEQQ